MKNYDMVHIQIFDNTVALISLKFSNEVQVILLLDIVSLFAVQSIVPVQVC